MLKTPIPPHTGVTETREPITQKEEIEKGCTQYRQSEMIGLAIYYFIVPPRRRTSASVRTLMEGNSAANAPRRQIQKAFTKRVFITMARCDTEITTGIVTIHGVAQAIGKHVIAQDALAGAYEDIRIEESADSRIVISALQVIEFCFFIAILATDRKITRFPEGLSPPGKCSCCVQPNKRT